MTNQNGNGGLGLVPLQPMSLKALQEIFGDDLDDISAQRDFPHLYDPKFQNQIPNDPDDTGQDPITPDPADPVIPDPIIPEPAAPVVVDGREIGLEQLRALAQFDDLLRSDPRFAQHVQSYITGQPSPNQPPVAPHQPAAESEDFLVPEEVDLNDPAMRFFAERLATQQEEIRTQRRAISQFQQQAQIQQERSSSDIIASAQRRYIDQHPEVSAQEWDQIRGVAARSGYVNALMGGVDPITGYPVNMDTETALLRAFELSSTHVESLMNKRADARVAKQQESAAMQQQDQTRKARAGALSGSPASTTPRIPTAVDVRGLSQQERSALMIAELAQGEGG